MAEGYVIGSGGGSAFDPTGSASIPIYIDSEGEARAITSIDPSILKNTVVSGNDFYVCGTRNNGILYYNTFVRVNANNILLGAGWNDYAEFRKCQAPAGTCVIENGDGTLAASTRRLQRSAQIISDTFGIIIGEEAADTSAIAIAGRVLAKPDNSKFVVGAPVCSGNNGTISRMRWWEVILFPDRIIGYVSEIPTYTIWNKTVQVENRIWVRVK